jgi:hypothetical protein
MCGDDARFEKTMASYKENPKEGGCFNGFYGETLEVTLLVLEVGYLWSGTRHYKVKRQYFI